MEDEDFSIFKNEISFGGHDVCLKESDSNKHFESFSSFGNAFELPAGFTKYSMKAYSYLAGLPEFNVVKVEVY